MPVWTSGPHAMLLSAIQITTADTQEQNANSTLCSQAVTHPSTNKAQRCLTSVIGRELVCST